MRSFVRFFSFFFFVEDITVLQDVIREEVSYTSQEKERERLHERRKCYVVVASSIQGELFLFTRRFLYIVQISLEDIVYRVFPVKKSIARRRRESVRFVRKVLLSLCILYSVP